MAISLLLALLLSVLWSTDADAVFLLTTASQTCAQRFASPQTGDFCGEASTGIVKSWNGSAWISLPNGTITNVKDYGAKGDDATDDTAALQAAHDALPAAGGVLLIPNGTFRFSTLAITKYVQLSGAGCDVDTSPTVLKHTGSAVAVSLSGASARGSIVSGFRLHSAGTGTIGLDVNIQEPKIRDVCIWNTTTAATYQGFSTAAIRVGNAIQVNDLLLRDLYIRQQPAIGVALVTVSEGTFDHVALIQNQTSQLKVGDASNTVTNLNIVNGSRFAVANVSGSRCIDIWRSVYRLSISESYFESDNVNGANYCIDFSNVVTADLVDVHGYFIGNSFGASAAYAIRLAGTTAILRVRGYFIGYGTAAVFNTGVGRDVFANGAVSGDTGIPILSSTSAVRQLGGVQGSTLSTDILGTLALTGKLNLYNGAAPADGQVLIGGTTAGNWTAATIAGTSNQITSTPGNNTITLSTPQNIHTSATPQFSSLGLGAAAGAAGTLTMTAKLLTYNNAAPTDGQVLIGGTAAANFTAGTLTAGTGIGVANGNNTITISTTGTAPTILANSGAYTAISNTTTETYFGIGTDGQVSAGALNTAKKRIEIDLKGVYGSLSTDSIVIKVKFCTVSGCGSGTVVTLVTSGTLTPALSETNAGWMTTLACNTFTTGASGTLDCQGFSALGTAAGTALVGQMQNTAVVTVDLTVAQFVSASVTWSGVGAPSATDTIALRNFGAKVY